VRRQGPQPTAEAAGRVVGEVGQVSDELEQDHLGDVLGVGVLELPPQAPGMDLRPVAVDERRPGGLIARVVAEGHQDADAGAAAGHLGHALISLGRDPVLSRMQHVFQVWNDILPNHYIAGS
jgi:hypothetical protein